MTTLDGYYVQAHQSQYGHSARLARIGCVPTSGANGANAVTGGSLTGDQVLALVKPTEEKIPGGGWHLDDLELAMHRKGISFENRTGQGWTRLRAARAAGLYIVLQGDSDQFGNATCSGAFDGLHAIGLHPASAGTAWRIDDPICPTGRWEEEATLHRYAAKLHPDIYFGVFTKPVAHTAVEYRIRLDPKAQVRVYTLSKRDPIDCIASWWDQQWGSRPSSAAASRPVPRSTCVGDSHVTTTKVLSGTFKGRHIRVGAAYGVHLEEA